MDEVGKGEAVLSTKELVPFSRDSCLHASSCEIKVRLFFPFSLKSSVLQLGRNHVF